MNLLKALSVLLYKTDYNRWKFIDNETHKWDDRNKLIAAMIPCGSSVLDLGAGSQTLRHYLNNCHYQPIDLIKTTPDTILCDFNKREYPDLINKYDYVVCSGLFEYIRDPKPFLQNILDLGMYIFLTYAIKLPHQSKISRMSQGWVNHLTQTELEIIFGQFDFEWSLLNVWNNQTIYKLRKN